VGRVKKNIVAGHFGLNGERARDFTLGMKIVALTLLWVRHIIQVLRSLAKTRPSMKTRCCADG